MNVKQVLKKYVKSCLITGLFFCLPEAYSQEAALLFPLDSAYNEALSKSFLKRNDSFLSVLKKETGNRKLMSHYYKNYKAIFQMLHEEIKEGQMVDIPLASGFLDEVASKIKEGNPGIPEVRVLLFREDVANAYTIGDGHLFIYLGLLHYLESEDQVAGVLAHEIGHLLMKHTLKALSHSYEQNRQLITDVYAIRQAREKKSDRAFELLKNSIYTDGKIKREFEMEADSMGYVLLKNTGYKTSGYLRALEIVEQRDTVQPDGLRVDAYRRFFDLPTQKFNEKWLEVEDFSSYNYGSFKEKFDKDSTASHPKTIDRIQHLRELFPELKDQKNTLTENGSDMFKGLQALAEKARIPNLYFNEQYGEVIYASLLNLQKDATDTTSREWLGKGFGKIYQARKDYQLNKFLDRIAPKDQTTSYIQFLSFMWNLKLGELKNIADFYNGI